LVPFYRADPDGSWIARHPGFKRDPEGWVLDAEGRLVVHEEFRDERGTLTDGDDGSAAYRIRRYTELAPDQFKDFWKD
jgi:hypothetical protein